MLRLIGVLFIAVLAQFIVHGWNSLAVGVGENTIDEWRQDLKRQEMEAQR